MKTYYPYARELLKHTMPPRPSNEYNAVKVYVAGEVDKEIERLKEVIHYKDKEIERLHEVMRSSRPKHWNKH